MDPGSSRAEVKVDAERVVGCGTGLQTSSTSDLSMLNLMKKERIHFLPIGKKHPGSQNSLTFFGPITAG